MRRPLKRTLRKTSGGRQGRGVAAIGVQLQSCRQCCGVQRHGRRGAGGGGVGSATMLQRGQVRVAEPQRVHGARLASSAMRGAYSHSATCAPMAEAALVARSKWPPREVRNARMAGPGLLPPGRDWWPSQSRQL